MIQIFNTGRRFTLWGIDSVLSYSFKKNGITYSSEGVRQTLKMSASYPNIDSVSKLLDAYRCPNMLARVEVEDLKELEYNAILYMQNVGPERNEYYYAYFLGISNDQVQYYIPGQTVSEHIDTFKAKWTSNLLLFRKTESSGEKYWQHKKIFTSIKNGALIIGVVAAAIGLYRTTSGNPLPLILMTMMFGLVIAGLYLSIDLYKLEKGLVFNATEKNKCFVYKGFNCAKVFSSRWGKLLNFLSLAELGTFYFFSLAVFIAFKIITNNLAPGLIVWLTIPTVLFVSYSLLTQWLVIRSWCSKCLLIQAILVCNAAIGLVLLNMQQGLTVADAQTFIFILLIQIVSWNAAKELLNTLSKHDFIRAELEAYKKDPGIFLNRVEKAGKLIANAPADFYIDVNNHEGQELTIILSPFCEYCGQLVQELDKLAVVGKLNARVHVVMNTVNDKTSNPYQVWTVVSNTLTVQPKNVLEVLLQWYALQDIDKFKQHYNYELPASFPSRILNHHLEFCGSEGIRQTPCIYYQNARIDNHYSLTDFCYFFN
jgi:uncharacterized membrane protein